MSEVSPEGSGWQVLPDGWLRECVRGQSTVGEVFLCQFFGVETEAQGG